MRVLAGSGAGESDRRRVHPALLGLLLVMVGWALVVSLGGPGAAVASAVGGLSGLERAIFARSPVAQAPPAGEGQPLTESVSANGALREGSRGVAVVRLQQLLRSLGFDLAIDGIFGPESARAVRAFQEQLKLAVDGVVGPATARALEEAALWYSVRSGDTLWGIAQRFGSTVDTLTAINGLKGATIRNGQRLLVPRAGVGGTQLEWGEYIVRAGDTLTAIARRFGIPHQRLVEANRLENPDALQIGQHLLVPLKGSPAASLNLEPLFPLLWPAEGRISSPFGWRRNPFTGDRREFHGGMDIALPAGTEVRAAAAGRVVQAGWMGSLGWGVVLQHSDAIQTLYGHNSRLLVAAGDRVSRGEVIALSGSSGRSTGPHLDFRLRIDGELVDPIRYLEP